jgi:hypothetical protein
MIRVSWRNGRPRRLSSTRLTVLCALLALGVAACASPVGGRASAVPVPVLSAGDNLRQSLLNLAEAGVLHYRGSLVNPNGRRLTLDVSVTATGEAGGTVTAGDQQGSLLVVAGTLFVDAPARFWSLLSGDPGTEAGAVDSSWVKVPTPEIGVDIGNMLRPAVFGGYLARRVPAGGGPLAAQPRTAINGVPADRLPTKVGTVDVATTGTHGVLHVDVPHDPGLGTATQVSLDVADVSGSEAGVYQNLDQQAGQLSVAVDTSVDIEQGGQSWGTCTAAACSVVVNFSNKGVVATKVVVSGTWQGDGKAAGTCRVVVGPVAAGKSATAACTNDSPTWTTFFDHAHSTPGQHPYEVDWTAEALAAPPNPRKLTDEATAAATPAPADPKRTTGVARVYVIDYQDPAARQAVWKYGVSDGAGWLTLARSELAACRATSHTSCAASLVSVAPNRPSADALVASLVAKAQTAGSCPPGQWVDCTGSPRR